MYPGVERKKEREMAKIVIADAAVADVSVQTVDPNCLLLNRGKEETMRMMGAVDVAGSGRRSISRTSCIGVAQ